MEKLKSEYPTEEQMRELFEARKKPGAIAEILRRWGQEAEKGKEGGNSPERTASVTTDASNSILKERQ